MNKFDRLFRKTTSAPEQNCTICLTELLNCRQLSSCGHLFHYRCLFQWMQTKAECPICRIPIPLNWFINFFVLSKYLINQIVLHIDTFNYCSNSHLIRWVKRSPINMKLFRKLQKFKSLQLESKSLQLNFLLSKNQPSTFFLVQYHLKNRHLSKMNLPHSTPILEIKKMRKRSESTYRKWCMKSRDKTVMNRIKLKSLMCQNHKSPIKAKRREAAKTIAKAMTNENKNCQRAESVLTNYVHPKKYIRKSGQE